MRNLVVNKIERLRASVKLDDGKHLRGSVTLIDGGQIIYDAGKLYKYGAQSNHVVDLRDAFTGENLAVKDVSCVGMTFLLDGNLVAAFNKGLLLSVDMESSAVEVVGNMEAGLEGIWKSPDDELLILVSGDGALILMTSRDFEPLLEFKPFMGENDAALANVNVGWGARETQFQGQIGKQARDVLPDAPDVVDDGETKRIEVVWREDGQFFAVSYVDSTDNIRRIRVYSREGQLQSTSEPVKKLGHVLAWKPGGAVIASSVTMANSKLVVGFFEKNGLRHGEFELRRTGVVVEELAWNSDGSILMVNVSSSDKPGGGRTIELWCASNYNWHLKQSWSFGANAHALWDTIDPMALSVFDGAGVCTKFDVCWMTHRSLGLEQSDLAFVGVVDGRVLKMTPFRQTVIPPPMSAFEIHLDANILGVMFPPPWSAGTTNRVAVITVDKNLHIFGVTGDDKKEGGDVKITGAGGQGFAVKCDLMRRLKRVGVDFVDDRFVLGNWTWLDEWTFCASYESTLVFFDMDSGSAKYTLVLESSVRNVVSSPGGAHVIVGDGEDVGQVWAINMAAMSTPPPGSPSKIVQAEYTPSGALLWLTEKRRLYADGAEVASGVNSFHVHSDFLMVTTTKHTLKCLPLASLGKFGDEFWTTETVRCVERGSRLVLAVPQDTKTIFQMPRGNLEVVHPRALVLHKLKSLLDTCQYKEAMEVLRRQRINLNVVVDHDPVLFHDNVEKFVADVDDSHRLCVFIADLRNEDTTQTMYKSMYPGKCAKTCDDKVDKVCCDFLNVMARDEDKFILPIVSCLVKSSNYKIEDALMKIQQIKGRDAGLADEALNFLLLLVDVNDLFDVALGLYDFDLVLFVAEKSQKDPREYLPFLNELKRLPDAYRRYRIDVHLKRYESALANISASGEDHFDECLALVRSQRLYAKAVALFDRGSRGHREICRAYGEYLEAKKYYEDAALTFEMAGLDVEAAKAWEKSPNWQYCLSKAGQLQAHDHAEHVALCRRLAEKLRGDKRPLAAAQILVECLDDPEEAVVVLVEGRAWSDVARVASLYKRPDLIDTNLVPALKDSANDTLASIASNAKSFHEQLDRFVRVAEVREKVAAGLYDDVDINMDDIDLYSDTSSRAGSLSNSVGPRPAKSNAASLQTRASNRSKSSKNRRKNEKKKYSTKEGSTYEDLGLIAALHDLVLLVFNSRGEVGDLNRALVKFGFQERARAIQKALVKLLDDIKAAENKIWKPIWFSGPNSDSEVNKFGPEATTAEIVDSSCLRRKYVPEFSLLEPKYRIPPYKQPNDDWILQVLTL